MLSWNIGIQASKEKKLFYSTIKNDFFPAVKETALIFLPEVSVFSSSSKFFLFKVNFRGFFLYFHYWRTWNWKNYFNSTCKQQSEKKISMLRYQMKPTNFQMN